MDRFGIEKRIKGKKDKVVFKEHGILLYIDIENSKRVIDFVSR